MDREKLLELAEPRFDKRGDSNYDPCTIGLHLCGIATAPGDDYEQPYTALNIPAANEDEARAMFDAAKAEAECGKDEADFCCDLMVGEDCLADFWTNRQLVERLTAAALRSKVGGE